MSRTHHDLIRACAALIALFATGCTFTPPTYQATCEANEECAYYELCVEGVCTRQEPNNATHNATNNTSPADMSPPPPDQGEVDMGDMSAPPADMPSLPPCATDRDGDGFFSDPTCPFAARDCDDTNPLINPGAQRICNMRDNDCDGLIDREACDCTSGESEVCGDDTGDCVAGTRRCVNGKWGECEGRVGPSMEVCDGRDNDCNGQTDEHYPEVGDTCDTGLPGPCKPGRRTCVSGSLSCVQTVSPALEKCDAIDNDCDGETDEDVNGLVLARACGTSCPDRGVQVCLSGTWSGCEAGDIELCDNLDNNCDSITDGRSRCLRACGDGVATGTLTCTASGPECELPEEICGDGVDNDCDRMIDENCGGAIPPLLNMAYIPGGTFLQGSRAGAPYTQSDETPLHLVELSPYYIDRTEVSRAQYYACVSAGACPAPVSSNGCPAQQSLTGGGASRPIACVRFGDAQAYCGWLGKRLPTEAEWEKAARGPYPREVLWPWGSVEDRTRAQVECEGNLDTCLVDVDALPNGISYYGLHNMAGNLAEYVLDQYATNYYEQAPQQDPYQQTAVGGGHVIRGGSWRQEIRFARAANRAAEATTTLGFFDVGFRCARDAP